VVGNYHQILFMVMSMKVKRKIELVLLVTVFLLSGCIGKQKYYIDEGSDISEEMEDVYYNCKNSIWEIKDDWAGMTVELDFTNQEHNCKIKYKVFSTIEDLKILRETEMVCILPIGKMKDFDIVPDENILRYCEGQAKEIFTVLYER